jgi:hypothetical protein
MSAQSSGLTAWTNICRLSETRRCFAPIMVRTIAVLRPLWFAKWDKIFYFSGQHGLASPTGTLIAVIAMAIGTVVQVSLYLAPLM